jgi:hypothetical protein
MAGAAVQRTTADVLELLDLSSWEGQIRSDVTLRAVAALEEGKILMAPSLRFDLSAAEKRFLSPDCLDEKSKNISYRPASRSLQGTRFQGEEREEMLGMVRRFYEKSRALMRALCPSYREKLTDGFTSYRPAEIANRASSWRKDDTRLHVDAFPSRPMRGLRIMRVFTNLNPDVARVWKVGENFEGVAGRFLQGIKPPLPGSAWLLQTLHIVKGRRSLYDHYMLGLHDGMKASSEYQAAVPQVTLPIAPGATWICYTDAVSHAALSGQFALEQTYYLPVEAMVEPQRSPLRVLERMTGRSLV